MAATTSAVLTHIWGATQTTAEKAVVFLSAHLLTRWADFVILYNFDNFELKTLCNITNRQNPKSVLYYYCQEGQPPLRKRFPKASERKPSRQGYKTETSFFR